jgi:hypothetical protein
MSVELTTISISDSIKLLCSTVRDTGLRIFIAHGRGTHSHVPWQVLVAPLTTTLVHATEISA